MIHKALIPIAGLGTRMGPLARAVPKAMFPLVDATGKVRPVIQYIIDEVAAAGVRQAGLIVSPGHVEILRKYFETVGKKMGPGSASFVVPVPIFIGAAEEPAGPSSAVIHIEIIAQPEPKGFGDAVGRAEKFIGGEPFLLMLGDYVYRAGEAPATLADRVSAPRTACAAQVVKAFNSGMTAMVGMQAVGPEDLPRVGVAAGELVDGRVYRCRKFAEKPSLEVARRELVCTDLVGKDLFLAHCGIYVLGPEIFDCLAELSRQPRPAGAEIQLADAQQMLLARRPDDYYLYRINGRGYDTGVPMGYLEAQAAMRHA